MAREKKQSNYYSKDEPGYTSRSQKYSAARKSTPAATETSGPGQNKVLTKDKGAKGTYD